MDKAGSSAEDNIIPGPVGLFQRAWLRKEEFRQERARGKQPLDPDNESLSDTQYAHKRMREIMRDPNIDGCYDGDVLILYIYIYIILHSFLIIFN